MFKSKKISAIISLITATAISAGMIFSTPVAYAAGNDVQDFETVENTVESGWRVFGDAGIAPTLENDLGGNAGECLALKADNNIIKGTDSQVRYYISDNFDKTKDYTFKTKIYLEKSDDVSAYVVRLVGGEDNSGGTELSFNNNGSITGATVSGTTWSEGWHELRVSIDATDTWYAWLDSNIITYGSALKGNITAEDIEFVSLMTVYTDISHPVTSCIAVDDSEILNGIVGLVWNVDNKTVPAGSAIYGTAEYADNVFGDTAKGASIKIATAGGALPVMNNVLPTVGAGEAVSYSFDVGIDKFSTAADTKLAPYFFQVAVNSGKGWLGTSYGVTINNTGVINFFGVNTGKTIDAGKWHNFKYVLVSNADNTTMDMSLYVDGEYICTTSTAIPGAVANARYTINHVRFAHNATDSTLYLDNIRFEKNTDSAKSMTGLNWNVDNKTVPAGSAIYGTAEYADNVFGDTTKGASIKISTAGGALPVMNNVLPAVGAGEVVSYSFDVGIDKFSAAATTSAAPYYFQVAVNSGKGWLGTSYGVTISNTGVINFFGVNTGKTIDAGKWHNFKYVLVSNADNTTMNMSLYVDGKYICTANAGIPGAVANAKYTINHVRFAHNATDSALYIDNIKFEKDTEATKNVSGLNWDVTDKTKPLNTNVGNLSYTENVFGDTNKGASAVLGSKGGALQLNDVLPTIGAGEVVSYSFDLGIDKLSASINTNPPYFFQYLINTNRGYINGKAVGMSIDQSGLITFFGMWTGKRLEPGKWHNIKYLTVSNADNTTMNMSLYVDGDFIASGTWAVPGGSANARYKIVSARAENDSAESTMYIDNVRFEKADDITADNISSFNWNMDNETVPGSAMLFNGLEGQDNLYAADVFGDTSKASSLAIKPAASTPMLSITNPLSKAVGEAISYSFDVGVDEFSDSINTNPAYFLQMQINGGLPYSTIHTSIDSERKIIFFGNDTGKTIDAGKWHNFKYLIVPNQDDTELYISLCVDGEWICGGDYDIPNAVEGRGYMLNFVRLTNSSSESTLYVDNINFVKEVPGVAKNCITSESLLIDGKLIHGYKGMNASQLRSALTVADGAVVGAIRTVDGELVADDAAVAEGMTVTVEEGTSMRSYTLANEDMFASTDGSLYIKTPKYSDDSISTYTLLLDNGDGTADIGNIVYAVAVYDADLALTDVKLFPITLTEDDEDETVLDISEMTVGEEDALVIMAWDSVSNMEPVMEKHTLKKNTLATDAAIAGAFMDHMVLQRDMPINIWGTSDDADGAKVEISFAGNTAVAVVEDGEWETTLPAVSANATAQTLTVKTLAGEDTISDILVGDVYFVGGQSNATFQLGGTDTWETDRENATADDNIRIMFSQNGMNGNGYSVAARKDPFKDAVWQIAEDITEEEAGAANYGKTMINFSAIGYYFADTLRADGIDVPIGLISTGKTSASLDQLSPASICADSTDSKKGQAYNGLIAPVEKMTVKGMLWYQGESDSISDALVKSYEGKFAKLINYLRDTTGNKDMPVFMVQLSSHSMLTNDSTRSWNVPKFRAMQFDMMQSGTIKNLYMVPSLDKGWKSSDSADTDHLSIAHPKYKKPIGQRLAKVAENVLYNGENVLAPVPVSVEYADGYCTITFDKELAESTVVAGFELIKDGAAYTANAKASGNTVNVVFDDSALANTAVDGVRYAFYQAAAPSVASLTGINGLPVPTFAFDNGEQEISALDIAMISRGAVETAE